MCRPGFVAVCLCLLAAAPRANGQTELRWKFQPGDKLYAEELLETQQSLLVAGKLSQEASAQTTVSSYVVEEVRNDGSVVLLVTIESVKNDKPSPQADRLPGAKFRVHFNSRYEATRIEGYEDFLKRMAGDDPALEKMLRGVVTKEALLGSFGRMLRLVPQKPVAAGETWSYRYQLPMGAFGSLAVAQSNTLSGSQEHNGRRLERILVSGNAAWMPPAQAAGELPFKIVGGDLKIKGIRGTAWFDAAAGRLVEFEMPGLETSGTLKLNIAGEEQDVELQQTQSSRVRFYTDAATR